MLDAPTGEEIRASARILFDNAAPVDTAEIVQVLDGSAPVTTLTVKPIGSADYEVKWSAADEAGGSGVKYTTIYVSEDGGAWTIWQRQSTERSAIFSGQAGKRYEFIAVSTDNAGNQERPIVAQALPSDGSQVNLGSLPSVGPTTQDAGAPPAASQTPSTNVLFLEAQQGVPADLSSKPSEFGQVLAPFVAEVFGTGVAQSHAGIGPLAILVNPDHSVIVSGGANRGQLYRFTEDGGQVLNPVASFDEPIFDLAYDHDGQLWATTGGGQLLQLDPMSFSIVARYGESLTQALGRGSGKRQDLRLLR